MFNFCPKCGSKDVRQKGACITCSCGLEYFENNAAAVGCIISTNQGILFVTRNKEPSKGALALPGGFVDYDEGAVEGLRRECIEEIGWDPLEDEKSQKNLEFFASFPNVYPYKGFVYHTCDLYFTVSAPELTLSDLRIDSKELSGIKFIKKEDIDLKAIAFEAVRRAIEKFVKLETI